MLRFAFKLHRMRSIEFASLLGMVSKWFNSSSDRSGWEKPSPSPRHARDVLREIHGALVEDGTRDQMTLVASGGIAMAEHVAKAVICGADLVAIDLPLLLAMECRLCGECERGEACPISLSEMDQSYAERRILNLMGAWHQQLIEMLGAMGIREMRRLRGETGRAMFFEDLEPRASARFSERGGRRPRDHERRIGSERKKSKRPGG